MENSQLTLAAYINGRWREETFSTKDPLWRETFKQMQASSIPVKILYPEKAA